LKGNITKDHMNTEQDITQKVINQEFYTNGQLQPGSDTKKAATT